MLRYAGLLLIFALVYFIVLNPIKAQLIASFRAVRAEGLAVVKPHAAAEGRSAAGGVGEKGLVLEEEVGETGSDVKRVVMLKRDLVDKVKKEPGSSSRLVQNWIRQTQEAQGSR